MPPPFPNPSRWGKLAAQLLNPIHRNPATKEIYSATKDRVPDMNTMENSSYVHMLVAHHPYMTEQRQFLLSIFGGAPLVPPDLSLVDPRLEAECRARIFEAQLLPAAVDGPGCTFTNLPLPVWSRTEVILKRKGARAPEVYLSDDEFGALFGCTKSDFYSLPEQKRAELVGAVFQ
jgi:hypothetical protein